MDPVKKFRIVFWVTFSVLVLVIAVGCYYFFNLDAWKEQVIADKNQKITQEASDLLTKTKLLADAGSQSSKDKETLAAENAQLTKDKDALTAENASLKATKAKALAYNEVFKHVNSVIETHNGFDGWTDAEFQAGKVKAEATGNTTYVSTINWCWYDHSVDQLTRALRFWKETATNIESSLK